MAKAYRINDRRGTNQSVPYKVISTNQQFQAATQTADRGSIPNLNFDFSRNISRSGLRLMRSVGQFLYSNSPIIEGALNEQAMLSVGYFIPQFYGNDRAWGDKAEEYLYSFHQDMILGGWQRDSTTFLNGLVVGARRDGEHLTILAEDANGRPKVQVVGPHRIDSRGSETTCKVRFYQDKVTIDGKEAVGRPFGFLEDPKEATYRIVNGVILTDYDETFAVRLYDDDYSNEFADILVSNCLLNFFASWPNQNRGVSALASGAFDWQDVRERRKFELLAQKLGSAIALIERNEAGEPMPGQGVITRATASTTPGSETGIATEQYEGGTIRYFKTNSGAGLESLRLDRPSADSQAFEEAIIRGAFKGIDWDIDFSINQKSLNGGQLRVVVQKINRTIRKIQGLATKTMRRIDGYAVSKAIKLGILPPNDEWYKFDYQGPAELTADAKYDDDIDRERLKMGGMTYREWYAKRGKWYEDEIRQRIKEQKFIEDEAKAEGVDVNKVQMLTPNGNQNVSPQTAEEDKPE